MRVDVAAKRGAVCNTNHHLVCAKHRFGGVRYTVHVTEHSLAR